VQRPSWQADAGVGVEGFPPPSPACGGGVTSGRQTFRRREGLEVSSDGANIGVAYLQVDWPRPRPSVRRTCARRCGGRRNSDVTGRSRSSGPLSSAPEPRCEPAPHQPPPKGAARPCPPPNRFWACGQAPQARRPERDTRRESSIRAFLLVRHSKFRGPEEQVVIPGGRTMR